MAKLRVLTSVAVMVAMLMAALPATAFAHSGDPVSCSLVLFVTDPGADDVKEKKKHSKVKNSGQMTSGWLDCGDITFDEDGVYILGAPIHPLDGYVGTVHGSKVKFNGHIWDTSTFKGKLKGSLTLMTLGGETLSGKIKSKVWGEGMLLPPGVAPLQLMATSETIAGEFELEGAYGEVEGDFTVVQLFPGVFAGSATVEAEFEGEDDD